MLIGKFQCGFTLTKGTIAQAVARLGKWLCRSNAEELPCVFYPGIVGKGEFKS